MYLFKSDGVLGADNSPRKRAFHIQQAQESKIIMSGHKTRKFTFNRFIKTVNGINFSYDFFVYEHPKPYSFQNSDHNDYIGK